MEGRVVTAYEQILLVISIINLLTLLFQSSLFLTVLWFKVGVKTPSMLLAALELKSGKKTNRRDSQYL